MEDNYLKMHIATLEDLMVIDSSNVEWKIAIIRSLKRRFFIVIKESELDEDKAKSLGENALNIIESLIEKEMLTKDTKKWIDSVKFEIEVEFEKIKYSENPA